MNYYNCIEILKKLLRTQRRYNFQKHILNGYKIELDFMPNYNVLIIEVWFKGIVKFRLIVDKNKTITPALFNPTEKKFPINMFLMDCLYDLLQ